MSRLCTDTDISTSWLILEIMNSDNFMVWTGFAGLGLAGVGLQGLKLAGVCRVVPGLEVIKLSCWSRRLVVAHPL